MSSINSYLDLIEKLNGNVLADTHHHYALHYSSNSYSRFSLTPLTRSKAFAAAADPHCCRCCCHITLALWPAPADDRPSLPQPHSPPDSPEPLRVHLLLILLRNPLGRKNLVYPHQRFSSFFSSFLYSVAWIPHLHNFPVR